MVGISSSASRRKAPPDLAQEGRQFDLAEAGHQAQVGPCAEGAVAVASENERPQVARRDLFQTVEQAPHEAVVEGRCARLRA